MTDPSGTLDSTRVLLAGATDWTGRLADVLETDSGATVRTVATADDALTAVRDRTIDCLVTDQELDGSTGIGLLRAVRDETATLPVVLCTASGSEAIASEAISADVTDYIALADSSPEEIHDVVDRLGRAVRTSRRTITRRDRARQFDAIFHDTRTSTWVLDPNGSTVRANEVAREMADREIERVVERPFWTLPCWSRETGTREDVERIIRRAIGGEFSHAVVARSLDDGDDQTIELSARPVRDGRGTIVSIVVEGVDITERVDLERDLRRSEELHRVTLNNMTDTVLITNEAGEYTYVCPNVHFIFGYSADEIRTMGTIEDLLGGDVFDRDELAAEGVLKNIECTATDEAGREHTLLVNVREVAIQGGTLLYSCRDVTKRKQREEALATLQETARDFLYAETPHEIARHIVDDVPAVLDLEASAVHLFDADRNEFRPVAHSPAMERLNGPLPTVHADADGLIGHSFLEGESLFFDDVHDADRLDDHATGLRSAAFVPLGDHGVFVAGSPDVARFDGVTRELTDLLAATAEAALDRITRESRLREQDRELQRRNAQLTALNRTNGIIREIDQALVRAETRAEIDHAVCELLTADDRFSFAWIGVADSITETITPRAWAGAEQGYLDGLSFPVDGSGNEPAIRTASTHEVTMVTNVADGLREEAWRKKALARNYLSVVSVPLAYDELAYGVLTVYANARNAFEDNSGEVLAELGETIASATSAIERKNALLTTSITRLEFDVDAPSFVLSRIARAADCALTYQGGVQQTGDGSFVFVTVAGAEMDAVERIALDLIAVDGVQRISADGAEGVFRLRLAGSFLALELADHGAILRGVSVDPANTTLEIDVPESVDVHHVTQLVSDSFASVDLRSKQTLDRSSTADPYERFLARLTDRQLEVVQTAYYSGFFESPRESTGEEVAEALDISPTAFYRHTRTVQRKLFSTVFDERSISTTG